MRILIDECVDPRVKKLFAGHEAKTVHEMGWDQLKDGPLLKLAEQSFDVFITIDRNLEYQQNLSKLLLGVIVVRVPKNQMPYYVAAKSDLLAAIAQVQRGQVVHV
jgi:predicted nuclease of predicted toxin-antitoxin system